MAEESSSISSPDTHLDSPRKKRRTIGSGFHPEPCGPRWRNRTEQQIYSSKLVHALRALRRPESSVAAARAVRDAADRVLAFSAKGRTRWSRAMLTRRLSQIKRKHKRAARSDAGSRKPAVQRNLPPVQRKVRTLRRLVPGCRKASLRSLLEETTDYIAALEMQVNAMAFISGISTAFRGTLAN